MKLKVPLTKKFATYIEMVAKEIAKEPPQARRKLLEEAVKGQKIDEMLDRLGIAADARPDARLAIIEHALVRAKLFAASRTAP